MLRRGFKVCFALQGCIKGLNQTNNARTGHLDLFGLPATGWRRVAVALLAASLADSAVRRRVDVAAAVAELAAFEKAAVAAALAVAGADTRSGEMSSVFSWRVT